MEIQDIYSIVFKAGMIVAGGVFAIYFAEKLRKSIRERKKFASKDHEQIIQEYSEDIDRIALYLVSNELKKPKLPRRFGYSLENYPVTESTLMLGKAMKRNKSLELRVKEEIETGKAKIRAFVDKGKPSIDVEYEIVN